MRKSRWSGPWTNALAFALVITGCVGEKAALPAVTRPDAIGAVTVSPPNAIMAVGGTLQLSETSTTVEGGPLANADSVRYVLVNINDTARVTLSPSGLVTARASTGTIPALVNVLVFKDGLGSGDQAVIQITSTAFTGATLALAPLPPDSTILEAGSNRRLIPLIQNTSGQSILNRSLRFWRKDADIPKLSVGIPLVTLPGVDAPPAFGSSRRGAGGSLGRIQASQSLGPGTVWVYLDVNVYGALLRDSVLFTLTWPTFAGVDINNSFGSLQVSANSTRAYMKPGGSMSFSNSINENLTGVTVAFTLDNPAAATLSPFWTIGESPDGGSVGNVTPIRPGGFYTYRRFATAGTYHWTAIVGGNTAPFSGRTLTGTIIVQ